MRCMVLVKASKDSEAGVLPSTELLTNMDKFNEDLVKAGVMLAGEGLQHISKGKHITYTADKWLKRSPFGPGAELEIRQVFEAEDFGAQMTAEIKEREERLRNQISQKNNQESQ